MCLTVCLTSTFWRILASSGVCLFCCTRRFVLLSFGRPCTCTCSSVGSQRQHRVVAKRLLSDVANPRDTIWTSLAMLATRLSPGSIVPLLHAASGHNSAAPPFHSFDAASFVGMPFRRQSDSTRQRGRNNSTSAYSCFSRAFGRPTHINVSV